MGGGGAAAKKAAKIQAKATLDAANAQAAQARLQAQAAQQTMEAGAARARITEEAKANAENQTVDKVKVEQNDSTDNTLDTNVDQNGRRRAPRDAFRVKTAGQAGINI